MTDAKELVKQAADLADNGQPDEAIDLCNRVLLDQPDHPGALFVTACVLLQSARHVQAIQIGKRITAVAPKDSRGWMLLGIAFGEIHKYDESIRNAEHALSLKRDPRTLSNAAFAHINAGNWDIGDRYSREAIERVQRGDDTLEKGVLDEALRDALIHQASICLARKDWRNGFVGYRKTMRTKWRKEWVYGDTKEWTGEDDAVVMVTGEQGLGDEIMAASMVPDAAKWASKFILDCDERLGGLFARSFPSVIVTPTRRSQTVRVPVMPTHHKSLFGLGEIVRTEDANFPRVPYLVADPDLRRMFRSLLDGKRLIGLAWSGGLPRTGLAERIAGLNAFLPLLRRADVQCVSLQYKDDAAEVAEFERTHGIRILRYPWVTQGQNMDLLAALIAELDEVVGVHTTALHLSSALGVPTTVLTHRGSGWRYAPDELMWYPRTTVMHKKRTGESWRDSVARLVEARKVRNEVRNVA